MIRFKMNGLSGERQTCVRSIHPSTHQSIQNKTLGGHVRQGTLSAPTPIFGRIFMDVNPTPNVDFRKTEIQADKELTPGPPLPYSQRSLRMMIFFDEWFMTVKYFWFRPLNTYINWNQKLDFLSQTINLHIRVSGWPNIALKTQLGL